MSETYGWNCILLVAIVLFVSESCVAQQKGHMNDKCSQPQPENVNPMECCATPEIVDAKIIEKCGNRVYSLDEMIRASPSEPAFVPHFRCVAECILNETTIIQDQKFMPDVATELAKKALGPKNIWFPVIEGAIKTCNEYAMKAKPSPHKGCGQMCAYIVGCFNAYLFRNCPETLYNMAGVGCADLRESTKNCPIVAPPAQ